MDKQLNRAAQEKARELACKITVANDLDPEIQEELYGHIEDKLLAYKSGEEPIAADDKTVLARYRLEGSEHTSRRISIPQLPGLNIGWFRQVVLLALATTCAIIVAQLLLDAYQWCLPWREIENELLRFQARSGAELLWWFAAPVFLLLILRRWSSELRDGAWPWFARISPVYLAAMTLILVVAGDAIPKILIPLDGRGLNVEIEWAKHSNMLTSFLTRGALCLIWMTWAYSLSRNFLRAAAIGMAWVLFYHLASILPGSIALLAENSNQRLYAPHWLGQIAWRQLRPDRLPEHLAMYFAIVVVCALSILLATQDWRGIGGAFRIVRRPRKVLSNPVAMDEGFANGSALSDEEALMLVRARFGDAELLRVLLQRVHLGVARTLPIRRVLALAITTLALCTFSDIAGSALRLVASMAFAADLISKSEWLPVALGLFDFPLITVALSWLLLRWRRAERDGLSPWFQRWPLRRIALVALVFFLLQLLLPTLSIAPKHAFGGTALAEFFTKALLIPVLLAIWLWWSGATTGGPRWIAAIGALFAPVMMVALLQPLRIFNLIPKVPVTSESSNWMYLKSTSLGRLNLDFYFAPDWMFTIGGMNLYWLCLGGTLLLVGLKELVRELSWARHSFETSSDVSPLRLT